MQQHSCSIQLHWVCSAAWKDCGTAGIPVSPRPRAWGAPQPPPHRGHQGVSPRPPAPTVGTRGSPRGPHLHRGPSGVVVPKQPVPGVLDLLNFLFLQLQLTHQGLPWRQRGSGTVPSHAAVRQPPAHATHAPGCRCGARSGVGGAASPSSSPSWQPCWRCARSSRSPPPPPLSHSATSAPWWRPPRSRAGSPGTAGGPWRSSVGRQGISGPQPRHLPRRPPGPHSPAAWQTAGPAGPGSLGRRPGWLGRAGPAGGEEG